MTYIPKGLFRLKTHEAASPHQQASQFEGMAKIAMERALQTLRHKAQKT